MESPVVVDKPPEYHAKDDRGFPFDEEEGSDAWSDLAARHPDIAARLRRDPAAAAAWARKRRSPHAEDFGDRFGNFDRFPFNDIPPEFREHFPSHWNRRFGSREEAQPQEQFPHPQHSQQHSQQPQQSPSQQSTSTQTEHCPPPTSEEPSQHRQIPQYGLRNTVDLGQKSAADPSLVDGEARAHRSMSAPPAASASPPHTPAPAPAHTMSAPQSHEPHGEPQQQAQTTRIIPIMVEGRDEPVINRNFDSASHFGDAKPSYAAHHTPHPPPHPHHVPHPHHASHPADDAYFTEDVPMYHPPRNFSQAYGTPSSKPFRPPQQPFAQHVYPQGAARARGASPKPQHQEEIKIPVQHEKQPARPQPPPPQQPRPQPPPPQQPQPQQTPTEPHQHSPPHPPPKQTQPQDPITQILAIQTDVLNLMTEVEQFTGRKNDKRYLFLDEMLTRNLIKLDNIETEGKENIRNARKEAIRCIQKCIAVLEAKAESNLNAQQQESQPSDQEMRGEENIENVEQKAVENGEVNMKESKEPAVAEQPQLQASAEHSAEAASVQSQESGPQAADTRPAAGPTPADAQGTDAKPGDDAQQKPKKGGKGAKKRDKSKDNKSVEPKECGEPMQVDDKGDKELQKMEVDGAASQ